MQLYDPNDATVWRRWLLVLCGVSFVAFAWDLFTVMGPMSHSGMFNVHPDPAFHEHVFVRPNWPAYQSGLRNGDSVAILRLPAPARYRFPGPWWGTDPIDLPVDRGKQIEIVRVRPEPARGHQSLQVWLAFTGLGLALAAATLLVFRRAANPEARILSLFLILGVDSIVFASNNWITPWAGLDACVSCVAAACGVAPALLATYALIFGRPVSRTRLVLTAIMYLTAAGLAIYRCALVVGHWYGVLDSFGPAATGGIAGFTQALIDFGLPLICLGLAIAQTRGAERTRISWAAGPIAFYYVGHLVGEFAALWAPATFLAGDIKNVALFVMPLGLTYALLSSRLLDIGFALNRAAMFAATTLLLAGLFAGLQSLANLTLSNLDRSHNIVLQLAIAVLVYYVVRGSRERTNALVTNLFFSHRERRVEAIRQLPNAVDALPDVDGIGLLVASRLRTEAGITATVFWQSASGAFVPANGSSPDTAAFSEDDPTIVALRARREPLRDATRSAAKAIMFPMLIRGQLRGVLLCEPPAGDGEFAPDEINAIAILAGRMASARDDLLSESLRNELERVRNRLQGFEEAANLRG